MCLIRNALFTLLLTACASALPSNKACTVESSPEGVYYERVLILDESNADEFKVLYVDRSGYDAASAVNVPKKKVLRINQAIFVKAKKCQCPPGFWGADPQFLAETQ